MAFLLMAAACAGAQTVTTTVNISNTVKQAKVYPFGINVGGITNYQQNQYLKNLNYFNGGDMPSVYWQTTFSCQTGGTNDTTHWYSNTPNPSRPFPVSHWVGAPYVAYSATTGLPMGSGTITASTSNNAAGVGLQFTLSSALTGTCSTANQDALVVRYTNAAASLTTPSDIYSFVCSGATFNTGDTSPNSTNTIQSLQLPASCVYSYGIDIASHPGTNTNATIKASNASWIDLNGSYALTFRAKCSAGPASMTFSAGRNGGTSYVSSTTINPTCNATAGAGWTDYSFPFTAAEVGLQANGGLRINILGTTGTMLVQDVRLTEGTAIAGGNSTVFRDAVVKKLLQLKPASIRFMDGSDWCSTVGDEIGPQGNNRFCSFSEYAPFTASVPVGYDAKLALCLRVDADCWITVGVYNQASDWASLITWLSTNANYLALVTAGHTVWLEDGNEPWNFGSQGQMFQGAGKIYGYTLGLGMAAAKAATGYNSTRMKLVGAGWMSQPYTSTGNWSYNSFVSAQASGSLPDCGDNAVYTLNYLQTFDTSGADVSTTGAPFLDAFAENFNFNSSAPPAGSLSMYNNTANLKTNFSKCMAVYEANQAILFGQTPSATQLQMDEIEGSWGEAQATIEGFMLMHRDSQVTGPVNTFKLLQDEYGTATGGSQIPLWGIERLIACGPGEIGTCSDADRPIGVAMRLYNNAMGTNTQLMTTSQSGTPTTSYAGGQSNGGAGGFNYSIFANAAVPLVQCASYSDGASHWTTFCFNNDLVNSQNVTFTGAGAPASSVSMSVLPGAGNSMISHNENTYLGASSIAPVVTYPAATATSGATYSMAPGTMMALTYSTLSTTPAHISQGRVHMQGKTVTQ